MPYRAILVVLLLTLVACDKGAPTPAGTPPVEDECKVIVSEIDKLKVDVDARFESAMVALEAGTDVDRVREVKSSFDATQNDYQLLSQNLCRDVSAGRVDQAYYQRHRLCLDEQFIAMRAFERTLGMVGASTDTRHATHLVEMHTDWMARIQRCFENARDQPEAFAGLGLGGQPAPGQPPGCGTSTTGQLLGGMIQLAPTSGQTLQTCQPITLEAELICERRDGDAWTPVPNCNGAKLRHGDRFKVSFSTDRNSHLYFFLSNDTGQFQMFFPSPEIPNQTRGGARYTLPPKNPSEPDKAWITLDDKVKNVLEHIMLVAAIHPIKDLERRRGVDDPPRSGTFTADANAVRGLIEPIASRGGLIEPIASRGGLIEPIASRGGDYDGGAMLLAEDTPAAPAPRAMPTRIETTRMDVAAVHFIIDHQ